MPNSQLQNLGKLCPMKIPRYMIYCIQVWMKYNVNVIIKEVLYQCCSDYVLDLIVQEWLLMTGDLCVCNLKMHMVFL